MSEKNIKLVIAEKPSVEQSIAKVIGADKREDRYLEGNRRPHRRQRLIRQINRRRRHSFIVLQRCRGMPTVFWDLRHSRHLIIPRAFMRRSW